MKRTYSKTETTVGGTPGRKSYKKRKVMKSKKTTMQLLSKQSPFPRFKKSVLLYENAFTYTAASATASWLHACNDMYDFDRTSGNFWGNKQPLFYDNLLTVSGPYKEFYVPSWTTTYFIANETNVAVDVFVLPPHIGSSELDSKAEADNFPGVKHEHLTAKGGSRDYIKVTVKGSVNDVIGSKTKDANFVGIWNGSPSTAVLGGLFMCTADGTTSLSVAVSVQHKFNAQLEYTDALVS